MPSRRQSDSRSGPLTPAVKTLLAESSDGALFAGIAAAAARFGRYPGIERLSPSRRAPDLLNQAALRLATSFSADIAASRRRGARLSALRAELRRRGLRGFILPMTDEYRNEYLPTRAMRLSWLTGFTGSAGLAIVLSDAAGVWSDGRYTLQLRDQVDHKLFSLHHLTDAPPAMWLARHLKRGDRIGFDPWLHTLQEETRWREACVRAGAELVATADNPLDAVWPNQPPPPLGLITQHDLKFAGEGSAAKRKRMAKLLAQAAAHVLTLPESIAWILNVRGADVAHTPLPLSRAILFANGTLHWFVDARKLAADLRKHLGRGVRVRAPEDFALALDALGRAKKTVQIDPASAPAYVAQRLKKAGASLKLADDPCLLAKACKNPVELAGAEAAHVRDGRALTRFLAWLDAEARGGGIDELTAAAKLQAFRLENELIQDLSFPTISGAGANGAVVHYRVTAKSNRRLRPGSLYLVDSGAQYLDGTTDVTRTVAIGKPSGEMRDRFTRVLKGHIALARAHFPQGATGEQLDALARQPLWQAGLDYDHGTGHGVGSYLGVHEGPQRIAKGGSAVALRPGMILSNEPGYYKPGAFGIRIENLVVVSEAAPAAKPGRRFLGFYTLTLAPIDRRLIDAKLLSPDEREWLDGYHARVAKRIGPGLDKKTRAWLKAATAPLKR